jgi:hypothetical protein
MWATDAFVERRPEVQARAAGEGGVARRQLFVFVASWLWNQLAKPDNATASGKIYAQLLVLRGFIASNV